VQRYGSALNLNPHLHVLIPDGVWVTGADGSPAFVAVAAPAEQDIQRLVERTAQRLVRLLEEGPDPLAQEQPLLAALTAASLQGRVATGVRAGQRLRRRLADPAQGQRTAPLCYAPRGFSLHAATRVPAADRERLEHRCRYVLRPPLAAARLRWLDPQTLAFTRKTPWDDGTTARVVSPHELLERLAALVPPPHLHLIRAGVAPHRGLGGVWAASTQPSAHPWRRAALRRLATACWRRTPPTAPRSCPRRPPSLQGALPPQVGVPAVWPGRSCSPGCSASR
jgi:hypothetical protein